MSFDLFFTPTDAEKLLDFQPIKWGWLKFLGGLIFTLVLMANVVVLAHLSGPYVQHPALKTIVFFSVPGLLIAILTYALSGARGAWIESYFARNVRGYLVRFFVPTDSKEYRWVASVVTRSHLDVPVALKGHIPFGALTIELRLGGWISFGGTGIFESGKPIGYNHLLRNWCVTLHQILHTGAVLVRVEYTHPDADGKHEAVVLEVQNAIRLLVFASQRDNSVVSISDALTAYRRHWERSEMEAERNATLDRHSQAALTEAQDALERVKGERDAAQSAAELNNDEVKRLAAEVEFQKAEIERVMGRLNDAAGLLDEIAAALHAIHEKFERTQRLKSRIEALEIWAGLLCVIAQIHKDTQSPDASHWHNQLVLVEAMLSEARAANRRNRGRAQQSAA